MKKPFSDLFSVIERQGQKRIRLSTEIKPYVRTNSVTVPKKKIVEDLQDRSEYEPVSVSSKTDNQQIKQRYGTALYIIDIMSEASARISEVLQISHKDILENGKVILKRKKGGKAELVSTGEAKPYMIFCYENCINPFEQYNYHFVYRMYKELGLSKRQGQNQNCSVTHIHRHETARSIRKATRDTSIITNTLGHSSKKSQKYYGR